MSRSVVIILRAFAVNKFPAGSICKDYRAPTVCSRKEDYHSGTLLPPVISDVKSVHFFSYAVRCIMTVQDGGVTFAFTAVV
jgi:hypothetical protein